MKWSAANLIFEAIAHSFLHIQLLTYSKLGGHNHLCRVCAIYISFFIDCMHYILKLIHANRLHIWKMIATKKKKK